MPSGVFGDAAATNNCRWLQPFDPFQLSRSHTSQWIKVVMVPGDAVTIPKLWWHAVRSTPDSVAVSVPVRLDMVDIRTVRRRTCRRDDELPSVVRGRTGSLHTGEPATNS